MPRRRHHSDGREAAEALVRTAPLVSRWIERLLAAHDPPFTVAQYLAMQAIADGEVVGAELARRATVSPAAISQLLTALEDAGMLTRSRLDDDRRRQPITLTKEGSSALRSAQTVLRERLAGLIAEIPPAAARPRRRSLAPPRSSAAGSSACSLRTIRRSPSSST